MIEAEQLGGSRSQVRSSIVGVALFLCSLGLLTLETAATRRIGSGVAPEQIALLRSLGGLVLVLFIARRERTSVIYIAHTQSPWLQLLRGLLSVIGLWTYYYAFSRLPLAEATSLSYTKALWLGIFACAVLRERVRPLRWIAIIIAGVGAAVVINPEQISSDVACLAALGSAALSAAIITLTKVLEQRDKPITVMFYVATISLAAFAVPGVCHWTMTGDGGWWLLAIALLGPLGQYLGLLAVRSTDTSLLAPFDYLRLIFSGVLGYLVLSEIPGHSSVIGGVIILFGCLIAVWSTRSSSVLLAALPAKVSAVAMGTAAWCVGLVR